MRKASCSKFVSVVKSRTASTIRGEGERTMKSRFLAGTATAALSLALFSQASSAATLDDVMRRLDKLEKENAELRQQVRGMSGAKAPAGPPAAPKAQGNPGVARAGATPPAPQPPPP